MAVSNCTLKECTREQEILERISNKSLLVFPVKKINEDDNLQYLFYSLAKWLQQWVCPGGKVTS